MRKLTPISTFLMLYFAFLTTPWTTVLASETAQSQPAPQVDAKKDFAPRALAEDDATDLAGDDKDLTLIAEAMATMKTIEFENKNVYVLDKVPFLAGKAPRGVVLAGEKQTSINVAQAVEHVYVLFAVLDLEKESPAQLTVLRDDGVPTRIKWTPGQDIANSVGELKGKLQPVEQKGLDTKIAFEGKAKNGTPVRLFMTSWTNDNQWYGLTDLKFKMLDPKSKARFVLIGLTTSKAKKS